MRQEKKNAGSRLERFLGWLGGTKRDKSEYWLCEAPPEEERLPPRYHNLTMRERFTGWRRRSGKKTFIHTYNAICALVCVTLIGVLLFAVSWLPPVGDPDSPTNNEVPEKYITEGLQDTGATNIVAGVILDYRAFDTFGESNVLFVAVCAVMILLRSDGKRDAFDALLHEMEEPRHDIILKQVSVLLVPMIMIYGIYVIVNGHLGPGGGFSGGAIIGSAYILYASSYGTIRARGFFTYKSFRRSVFAALFFYAITKGYSFYTGANGIHSIVPLGRPGAILSGGLILPLNICVGIVVANTMYAFYILFSKGEML